MKYPTTRFVFDRKNTATSEKAALIQVEILLQGKKKYVSTGVKVLKGQWSEKLHVINCYEMLEKNDKIESVKASIDKWILNLVKQKVPFDWGAFSRFIENRSEENETFIDYIAKRIEERNDIRATTKKSQRKILATLEEFGRIVTFNELTRSNIASYYDFLLGKKVRKIGRDGREYTTTLSVNSAWGYMKILRAYIHDAIIHEKIDKDPSIGIKIKRGEIKMAKYLTEEEVKIIETTAMPNGSLTRVRDIFIFMCYSGLAFSDMMDFTPGKLQTEGDLTYLIGNRKKTGEQYIVLVLPKIKALLDKYDYNMPRYTNQQFNKRLKDVLTAVGIDKPISSHYARHTAAMMFLNKGVRIETVAKILGHSSVRITEQVYADILKKTVGEEMKMLI